jgi:acetyltransferase-like isoleucine patch superfamily enzyme
VATKDVRPYHVNVGIPAKSITVKPNAPSRHECLPAALEREGKQR